MDDFSSRCLILMALEVGKSRREMLAGLVSGESPLPGHRWLSSPCILIWSREKSPSPVSSNKGPSCGLHPYDSVTSQSPHLQVTVLREVRVSRVRVLATQTFSPSEALWAPFYGGPRICSGLTRAGLFRSHVILPWGRPRAPPAPSPSSSSSFLC